MARFAFFIYRFNGPIMERLFRRPRKVTDVYKVTRDQYGEDNPAELSFLGTYDRTPRRPW